MCCQGAPGRGESLVHGAVDVPPVCALQYAVAQQPLNIMICQPEQAELTMAHRMSEDCEHPSSYLVPKPLHPPILTAPPFPPHPQGPSPVDNSAPTLCGRDRQVEFVHRVSVAGRWWTLRRSTRMSVRARPE